MTAFLFFIQLAAPQEVTTPSFEAVSIRQTTAQRTVSINGVTGVVPASWKPCEYLPNRVRCRMPLQGYIREAFQLREFEIKAPSWTKEDMFDLEAVMPLNTPLPIARNMIKDAIIKAFNVHYQLGLRSTDVFALVATEDGPRLSAFQPDKLKTTSVQTSAGKISYNSIAVPGHYFSEGGTLNIFAQNLYGFAGLNRPVVNKTGLEGRYTIDLTWKSSVDPDDPLHPNDKGILKAMEEQIGLKLVKASEQLQYLTIESANRLPHEI